MKGKKPAREQRLRIIENILLKLNERLLIVENILIKKDVTKDEN